MDVVTLCHNKAPPFSLPLPPSPATAYWATSAQGGVTRRGVVLTYRLSLVIGSQ